MMNIIANGWFVFIFSSLGLISFGITIWLLFSNEKTVRLFALISLTFAILFALGWHYSATHRVVPINERWVIINKIKAKVDGGVRGSGITQKPLLGTEILKFPGAKEQPFCVDYTPALKEGYEITTHVCGVYDASDLDWVQIYAQYNFTEEAQMLNYWASQSKELVSSALKEVNYTKITTDRAAVANEIRDSLTPWFSEFGVNVSRIQLSNWDFTSAEVRLQVDQASAASMKSTVETQLLEAAKIARKRQLFEVETANQILEKRGLGLKELMESLGIEDDNAKAELASQMTWFAYAQNPPEDVQIILSVGSGGGTPISIPIDFGENPLPVQEIPEVNE
jgi:hypothetical protein